MLQRSFLQSAVVRALPRWAGVAMLACGLVLTACGGGGGDDSAGAAGNAPSETDATADASNGSQTGADAASALDVLYDTTASLSVPAEQPSGAPDTMRALGVQLPIVGATVTCAGGGTALLTISGGTLSNQLNGSFDAGERYTVVFTQCASQTGGAQVNGSAVLDVVSADGVTTAVDLTLTNLSVSQGSNARTLNGSASLSRTASTVGDVTTTTSSISATGLTLASTVNSRSSTFTLSNFDVTRTVVTTAGVVTSTRYSGHDTLTGSANGRSFSLTWSTTGGIAFDASGVPLSGQWTIVRPGSTLTITVANGTVTLALDEGSNGTTDFTWTFPVALLIAAEG